MLNKTMTEFFDENQEFTPKVTSENIKSNILCFGDSFTFCRQVNDNETWEYYLSELENTNVKNFGVGRFEMLLFGMEQQSKPVTGCSRP